jgi:hypothetical protein
MSGCASSSDHPRIRREHDIGRHAGTAGKEDRALRWSIGEQVELQFGVKISGLKRQTSRRDWEIAKVSKCANVSRYFCRIGAPVRGNSEG